MIVYNPPACESCLYMQVNQHGVSFCLRLFQRYWKEEDELQEFSDMLDVVFEEGQKALDIAASVPNFFGRNLNGR